MNNNNNWSSSEKEKLTHGMVMEEGEEEQEQKKIKPCKKVVIRYKECLKNHAAAIGGSATDGCGEFMPNGEEGSTEALKCSACNCHRNFHRKQLECDQCECNCRNHNVQQMLLSGKSGSARSESDEGGGGGRVGIRRPGSDHQKRFRTKFTQEQKEKMLSFAERAGWSLQKLEESVVQHFCQEIGIKRRVLKVWMHNNKHTFAKKNSIHSLT